MVSSPRFQSPAPEFSRTMKRDTLKMQVYAESDQDRENDTCTSKGSSSKKMFGKSSSMGRISSMGSSRRASISLSRDGSNRIVEDAPGMISEEAGDSTDRVVRDEVVGIGSRQASLGRMSNRSSWSKGSISLSRDITDQILDSISLSRELSEQIFGNVDDAIIAQAGDSGDRVVRDDIFDGSSSLRFEMDDVITAENGIITIPDDILLQSNRFRFHDLNFSGFASPVSPLPAEIMSPLPTDAILHSTGENQVQTIQNPSLKEKPNKLSQKIDYISYLVHLAVFGILGALTRYLLQKLFGPSLLALTSDSNPLYLDLPSNMVGSFLMGWFGIVFKGDIRRISDHLAVGLTTGYLGSLTTFSGWNQKMLDLSSKGHWVFAVAGILLGMFIVNESIAVGVESAEGLRRSLLEKLDRSSRRTRCSLDYWRVNTPNRHLAVLTVMLLILGLLWGLSGAFARTKLDAVTNGAVLWLGCSVAPPGVWARWYLARLNGKGLGRKGLLKWLPIGTLSANVLAACIMAALATIKYEVNTKKCEIIVNGIQFGFLGCLSTVSTFVAEVYAMRQSGHRGRALAYIAATILSSFAMGTLIYSLPVWVRHYH